MCSAIETNSQIGLTPTRESGMSFAAFSSRFFVATRCLSAKSSKYAVATFFDRRVQTLLSEMTGLNLDKVFAPRKERLRQPKYQLMSEEQFAKVLYVVIY